MKEFGGKSGAAQFSRRGAAGASQADAVTQPALEARVYGLCLVRVWSEPRLIWCGWQWGWVAAVCRCSSQSRLCHSAVLLQSGSRPI